MSDLLPWAVALGITLGLGLWSMLALLPRFDRPALMRRVAPSLVDVSAEARLQVERRSTDPLPVLGGLVSPLLRPARRGLGRLVTALFGPPSQIAARLERSGVSPETSRYRAEQLAWGLTGLAVGAVLAVAAAVRASVPPVLLPLLPAAGLVGGLYLRDWLLGRAITRRQERITEELPGILEFLTLSLSAGEGVLPAVRRVAGSARGELSAELGRVTREVSSGVGLSTALGSLADRVDVAAVSRWIGQLVGALERGTPLAQVLRAQASDARVDARRRLMESAGRKEVAMLVPLVFLILPVTIAIAIFPGIVVLYTGF